MTGATRGINMTASSRAKLVFQCSSKQPAFAVQWIGVQGWGTPVPGGPFLGFWLLGMSGNGGVVVHKMVRS